jgi:endopolyphosphatase
MRVTSLAFAALVLQALPGGTALSIRGTRQQQVLKGDEPVSETEGDERAWNDALSNSHGPSPSTASKHKAGEAGTRKLTGKFLHITDVHPDPYYKTHSDTEGEAACHRGKGPAGYFGAETSDCDSPLSLVNATFEWLRQTLRDEIDFIIWTGDSARHDNDELLPRSPKQVVQQNEILVSAFLHAFGKKENYDDDDPLNDFVVPIVPTLGNNDILPHNIFAAGPNEWTTQFLTTWRQFIPEPQRHQFHRGGWFSVEVIPGKLVVFSLNTLYFFASNSAVDGCVGEQEPGYEQFEWLRVQLTEVRRRGMKAMLMGHVAPARTDAKVSWEESCWQKYTLWMHHFRDILVGGLYGHMNIDHFFLQDYNDVKNHIRKGIEYDDDDADPDPTISLLFENEEDGQVTIQSAQDYLFSLRDIFAKIPKLAKKDLEKAEESGLRKVGGEFGERYSLTLVAPSVVPNYFPTIRVFSYNISGLEELEFPVPGTEASNFQAAEMLSSEGLLDAQVQSLELRSTNDETMRESRRKKKKPHKFHLPAEPDKTSPPGPAYSGQALTLLSFTQYYANLTNINNDYVKPSPSSSPTLMDSPDESPGGLLHLLRRWKPGKHHGKPLPVVAPSPKNFTFEVEYDTAVDKVYKMQDLTVNALLDLARRIAGTASGKEMSKIAVQKDAEEEDEEADELEKKKQDKKHKKKHKKHKKKHRKERKKSAKDKEWYAFLKRAFVGAIDLEDV